MSVKEDLLKAYINEFRDMPTTEEALVTFGARWMAERCAQYIEKPYKRGGLEKWANDIRQLAKELT